MSLPAWHLPEQPALGREGDRVSEADYWRYYYEAEGDFEWKDGRLEEKPVSDYWTYDIYEWFLVLLKAFLHTHPIAKKVGLEFGFRLDLGDSLAIRKPDLGVVCNDNPVPLLDLDRSYHGIFDICIEALSDSTKAEMQRDTVQKKQEYLRAGVREYYLLHHNPERLGFFYRNAQGVYQSLQIKDGIVRSRVLPGFQFRLADLLERPDLSTLMNDALYKEFVLTGWQADKQARQVAEQSAMAEQQARQAAEAEVARLRALLDAQNR